MTMLPARFRHRITIEQAQEVVPGKCWLWQGTTNNRGYGQSRRKSDSTRLVHRLVYELFSGPVPAGLQIDHLCRVRRCCNPQHLEPVTNLENALRSDRATRTHCIRGHELSGHNLILKRPGDRGRRKCRACMHLSRRRSHEARSRAAA